MGVGQSVDTERWLKLELSGKDRKDKRWWSEGEASETEIKEGSRYC